MAADALVIIDTITTPVQDQLVAIDLDGPWMVRRMPMHKINTAINEAVRKANLLRIDPISPVRAPMRGNDCHVTGLPYVLHLAANLISGRTCECSHDMDTGSILAGSPLIGDAT